MTTRVLSVIIARAGSKGVKSKCILPIGDDIVVGKIIKWASELKWNPNGIIFDTIVSTDINSLKALCRKHGVDYMSRSPELASDDARVEEVIYDACKRKGGSYDYISLLYGNVPTRYKDMIIDPVIYLNNNPKTDAVFSFQHVEKYNPAWMTARAVDGNIPHDWKFESYRRQDLPERIISDGHTKIFRYDYFMNFMKDANYAGYMYEQFGKYIYPWINDKLIIDIDSPKDYILAQSYFHYIDTH